MRIAIYDRKNYFFRYLISKFKSEYELVNVDKPYDSINGRNKKISIMIFLFYEESDIVEFLNYYSDDFKVIICSDNIKILESIKFFQGVYIIDTNTTKDLIFRQINSLIQL